MRRHAVLCILLIGIHVVRALVNHPGRFLLRSGKLQPPSKHSRQLAAAQGRHTLNDAEAGMGSERNYDLPLFGQWAEEERALQEQLDLERRQELDERDDSKMAAQKLPAYVMKMLRQSTDQGPVPASKLPTVVVIGRPNTGKSTLVNRISRSHKDGSIVHDDPGITRDRTYRTADWCGCNFQIVDTGGIVFDDTNDIFAEHIVQQAITALKDAQVVLLVCNGQEGLTFLDEQLVSWLRKVTRVPVLVAVNKCESVTQGIVQAQAFWSCGFGEPFPVSAIHGSGVGELLDKVIEHIPRVTHVLLENATNVALVGRPNVGKSSLFNRMYGKERVIVSATAGTTRDCVDESIQRNGQQYRIIDTAGIRKKGKIQFGAEFFMVNRAFKAIRRADVVVLVLDAVQGLVEQDRVLAERIVQEGRACVIALNKWDAVPNKNDKSYLRALEMIETTLPMLRFAKVVLLSALTGQRTEKLFEAVDVCAKHFQRRIPTAVLNEVVHDATLWMAPPTIGARSGRIYYAIQVSTAPPTVVFFVNDPALFPDSYQRFLERKIREALDLEGVPIRMIWRGKSIRDVSRAAKSAGELGRTVQSVMTSATDQAYEKTP